MALLLVGARQALLRAVLHDQHAPGGGQRDARQQRRRRAVGARAAVDAAGRPGRSRRCRCPSAARGPATAPASACGTSRPCHCAKARPIGQRELRARAEAGMRAAAPAAAAGAAASRRPLCSRSSCRQALRALDLGLRRRRPLGGHLVARGAARSRPRSRSRRSPAPGCRSGGRASRPDRESPGAGAPARARATARPARRRAHGASGRWIVLAGEVMHRACKARLCSARRLRRRARRGEPLGLYRVEDTVSARGVVRAVSRT